MEFALKIVATNTPYGNIEAEVSSSCTAEEAVAVTQGYAKALEQILTAQAV